MKNVSREIRLRGKSGLSLFLVLHEDMSEMGDKGYRAAGGGKIPAWLGS